MLILTIGALIDMVVGDPHRLWHPVQGIGLVISKTEQLLRRIFRIREEKEADRAKKRAAGVILVMIVLLVSVGVPVLLLSLASLVHPWLRIALSSIMCWQILAMKSLASAAEAVRRPLEAGDTEAARYAVSMVVGRDTDRLDQAGIARAAIETVAENTSDGVTAPLMWLIFFGVPGGFFYKAVNTMDSMIGYKNDRYRYLGTAAALLDDAVNYIPSRLSALFMILAAFLLPGKFDGKNAYRIWRRDRRKHPSPNSAQTESVCAGALHIQLAGDMYYFGELHHKPTMGDSDRPVETKDIRRAVCLMAAASALVFAAGMALLAGLYVIC